MSEISKSRWTLGLGIALAVVILTAFSPAQWALWRAPSGFSENATRAPVYNGDAAVIDSDNSGSNLSAALNDYSRYCFQCVDAAWFEQGGSGASATADSDLWIEAGSILAITTTPASNYLAVLNKSSATADCYIVECR